MKKRNILALISLILASVMLFSLTACTAENKSETESTETESTEVLVNEGNAKNANYESSDATPESFSAELFRLSYDGKNTLISPLSVAMALAMVAEGAEGNTEKEFSDLFGGMSTDELSAYFKKYMDSLNSYSDPDLANSVWIREADYFTVKESFTDTVRRFYGADAFTRPFNGDTVNEINSWIKENTDGMIEKVIEELDPNCVMALVNTVLFEAEWSEKYDEMQVRDGEFTTIDGTKKKVTMMSSSEHSYLENGAATGFMKPYKGGKYAFAALLPKDGVTIDELIDSLDGEMLRETLSGVSNKKVITKMPQFEYDFGIEMGGILQKMGLRDAFDPHAADFSGISDDADELLLHIAKVIHKTRIELTPVGTKAGAATVVEMWAGNAAPVEPPKEVYLDRPFVYMIVDTETNLPVFIGAVTDIGE